MVSIFFPLLLSCLVLNINCEVITLNDSNFDELTSSGMWYLEFYAPWCGHCKKFAPIYEEASNVEQLSSINFAMIDATAEKSLAEKFDVHRFPTIKLLSDLKYRTIEIYTHKYNDSWEDNHLYDYSGQRTLDSLKEYGLQMLEPIINSFDLPLWLKYRSRHMVSFLFIEHEHNMQININDNKIKVKNQRIYSINYNIFYKSAMYFRPEIPFFYLQLNESQSKIEYLSKLATDLKLDEIGKNVIQLDTKSSFIFAICPKSNTAIYAQHTFDVIGIKEFVEQNRYSPIIELKLGNYRNLIKHCKYFGLLMIDYEQQPQTSQLSVQFCWLITLYLLLKCKIYQ